MTCSRLLHTFWFDFKDAGVPLGAGFVGGETEKGPVVPEGQRIQFQNTRKPRTLNQTVSIMMNFF